jgi:hypothetical protein
MRRISPLISASLAVAFAAGVAGIFTVATAGPTFTQNTFTVRDREVKLNQGTLLSAPTDLNSILFNSGLMDADAKSKVEAPLRGVVREGIVVEQVLPERTKDERLGRPMMNGCESGLSPDISPTVPMEPGRCISDAGNSHKFASIN